MNDNNRKEHRGMYPIKPYHDNDLSTHVVFPEYRAEGNHLRDYLRVIIRRRWVILVFFFSVIIIVTASSLMTEPQYQSSVTIKLDKENPMVVDFSGLQVERLSSDYYETQYKILKSRSLARRVIGKLDLDKSVDFTLRRSSFSIKSLLNKMAKLLRPLQRKSPQAPQALGADGRTEPQEEEFGVKSGHIDAFLARVEVSPVKDSRLINVSYRSRSPEIAQKVANTIAEAYIQFDIEGKLEASKNVGEFLENQIQDIKSKVASSEGALNDYSSKNEMIYLDGTEDKQSLLLRRLSEISSALSEATAERIQKEALYNEAMESGGRHPVFTENSVIEGLTKQYASLESEYFNLLNIYKPEYPKMKSLKSQMDAIERRKDKLRADVMKGLESDHRAAMKRENYLTEEFKAQKRDILAFQQKTIPYRILKRDVDANKQLHENLLQRLKEVNVAATQSNTNIQILDRAEYPTTPFEPDIPRNLMLSIIVGLMGGIGLAFFMEYYDDTVKDTTELESKTNLPAFGIVPHYKAVGGTGRDVPMIGHSPLGDPVAEAFRSIGTFILLSQPNKRPRSILITSPNEKEGKTTVCINTAMALAESSGPGIIIDADLRRPRLHKSFAIDNSVGLTTYLANKSQITDEGLIKPTSNEKLSVMTAGPLHPNPSALLRSPRFKELLDALYMMFDFVVIDSSPVTRINECIYLSSIVDGTVLVVRAGQTPASSIDEAKRIFGHVNANILGVVLNASRDRGLRQGYYSY